ncbi:hypothetical protein FA95DRAFT_1501350, partial [Auriscalpium vulgare]
ETRECAACNKTQGSLKQCSRCHSVLYCSSECQKSHWRTHKPSCHAFSADNTVTLTPIYLKNASLLPTASMTRVLTGHQSTAPSAREMLGSNQLGAYPKSVVVKIQVPMGNAPFLIYTKRRDFVCHTARQANPAAYDRVAELVKAKGAGGMGGWKGYFAAELKSADELVVKVSELLADQPF